MSIAVPTDDDCFRVPVVQLGHGQGGDLLVSNVGRQSTGTGDQLTVNGPLVEGGDR